MLKYDPFSEEVMRDPLPIYARLREEAPCYHIEEYDAWALSRFEDIWNASLDNEHFSCAQGTTSAHLLTRVQPVTPMLNLMDPPEHTELRAKIRPFFGPAKVRSLEPFMRELVREALEAARERGELDAMADLAQPLATKVACRVNGFPQEDGELLHQFVARFMRREPGVQGMTPDGLKAMEEMFGYFIGLIQKRRAAGADQDTVVDLFARMDLPLEAIASHLTMLIIGGSETFPKVFATGIRRLHEHPDQRAELARDPSLIPDAFQEILRFDMPTQFLCRMTTEKTSFHGKTIEPGQPVLFLYPSANRDRREFRDPDAFDIHRRPPRILTFGHGTHSCLGIHVAKAEGRIALEETLRRVPEYVADLGRAQRLVTDFVQGYSSLPISFEPW
jgi:cytochrome P450